MSTESVFFRPEPVVANSDSRRNYLPVERINNRFELIAKPFAWEVKGGKWLPVLSPIFFQRGLNNYDDQGVTDPEAVRSIYRRKSCVCIDPNDPRLGASVTKGGFANYIAAVPATNPAFGSTGRYYLLWCESPVETAGEVVWRMDMKAYDAFRQHLVDADIVKIDRSIADIVISKKKAQLSAMEMVPMNTEAKVNRLAAMKAEISAMVKALKGLAAPKAARGARPVAFIPEPVIDELDTFRPDEE